MRLHQIATTTAIAAALVNCRRLPAARRVVAALDVSPVVAPLHRPVAALYEQNPWLTVVSSDVPSVVLYEDGHVIHRVGAGPATRLVEGHIGPELVRRFMRDHIDFAQVAHYTSCSDRTDQTTMRIVLRVNDRWENRVVYGLGADGRSPRPQDTSPPPGFVRVYRDLIALRAVDDRPWVPETIEVMLWGFDYAETVVPWPSDLPSPEPTLQPRDGGTESMYLAGRHRARLVEFLQSLGATRAVSFNGRRWAAGMRDVVPEEGSLADATQQP